MENIYVEHEQNDNFLLTSICLHQLFLNEQSNFHNLFSSPLLSLNLTEHTLVHVVTRYTYLHADT